MPFSTVQGQIILQKQASVGFLVQNTFVSDKLHLGIMNLSFLKVHVWYGLPNAETK